MNKELFKNELKNKNLNVSDFAKATGNSVTTMYRKINESTFTNEDICYARKLFGTKKMLNIFFS